MKNLIYDIRQDNYLQNRLKERAQYFDDDFYIERYGVYGTPEWWDNIKKEGLIFERKGEILNLHSDGKLNFPMFKIDIDGKIYELECKGNEKTYKIGATVKLFLAHRKDIFQSYVDGEELLRIEIT